MLRKLVIATGALALLSGPAMAQGSWYVLKGATPTQAEPETQPCFVADRMASGTGEEQVAGPFPTQEAGEAAMLEQAACQTGLESDDSNGGSISEPGSDDGSISEPGSGG